MTKLRRPLTFENALTQIAGQIGWARTAEIVGHAERTVRNWSDPDTTSTITLDAALKLDEEFHSAGGDGTPFLLCYATQLEAAKVASCPELAALIACAAVTARESGEAVAAALEAATPKATIADLILAEREHEEAITAHVRTLAALKARREHLTQGNEGAESTAGALEVARPPPVTA